MARYFDDMKFLLDEGNYITSFSIAHKFNMTLDSARSILEESENKFSPVHETYLASLMGEGYSRVFAMLTRDELDVIQEKKRMISSHVYSIQRQIPNNLLTQLYTSKADYINGLLKNNYDQSTALDPLGGIKKESAATFTDQSYDAKRRVAATEIAKSSDVKSNGDLIQSINESHTKSQQNNAKLATKRPIVDLEAESDKFIKSKSSKSKSGSVITSLKSNTSNENIGVKNKSTAPPASTNLSDNDEEDAEWNDADKQSSKALDSEELKEKDNLAAAKAKRKTSRSTDAPECKVIPTELSEDDVEDKKKKTKPVIFGAMDDFVSSSAPEEVKGGEDGAGKRPKRKLVERMFADDKGYLVTEMVWEEVEEDVDGAVQGGQREGSGSSSPTGTVGRAGRQSDLQIEQKKPDKSGSRSVGGKPSKNKGKGVGSAGAGESSSQKNISSFFAKK